jgi:hypothetical protein
MSRVVLSILALLTTMCAASADIPPPPGVRENAFAEQIRETGHPCVAPVTYEYLEGKSVEEYTSQGLSVARVTCRNGLAYLVAVPPRRSGRNRPDAPNPAASALPIVRPIR